MLKSRLAFILIMVNYWGANKVAFAPNCNLPKDFFSKRTLSRGGTDVDTLVRKLKINLNNVKTSKKDFVKNWFVKDYLKADNASGVRVEELDEFKNSITIYKIHLSNDFATSLNKSYSIIYFRKLSLSFLLPIEYNMVSVNDHIMIGGFFESREFEFYRIYTLENENMILGENSSENCLNGVKVGYFRDDDCIEYRPNRLVFKKTDRNTITFSGKIFYYCKPGIDRNINITKPLRVQSVHLIYQYSLSQRKWRFKGDRNSLCW